MRRRNFMNGFHVHAQFRSVKGRMHEINFGALTHVHGHAHFKTACYVFEQLISGHAVRAVTACVQSRSVQRHKYEYECPFLTHT